MDQMFEEFEAARRKRDGATVGGETGVSAFEDGHHNAPFPQSGNHAARQDETEQIEQGALPPRERDFEQGVRHSIKAARRNSDGVNGPSKDPTS